MRGYEVIFPSGTITTTTSSNDYDSSEYRGAIVVVNVGAVGAGSVVATIEGKDRVSGKYSTILSTVTILTSQTKTLKVYPGITAANNASVSDVLPDIWRVTLTVASGTIDLTVGASLID